MKRNTKKRTREAKFKYRGIKRKTKRKEDKEIKKERL